MIYRNINYLYFQRINYNIKERGYNYIMDNRVYLNVPYDDKEEAKELGCRWDPDAKKWYYIDNYWAHSSAMIECDDRWGDKPRRKIIIKNIRRCK